MSLVEVMIALVVILVLMLGLVQTAIVSIDSNLRNVFRDEAVRIGEQTIGDLRNYPFDNAALNTGSNCPNNPLILQRNMRNIEDPPGTPGKRYTVCIAISNITPTADAKAVQVVVGWNHRRENPLRPPTNTEFQHITSSILRQQL
jgi:Tfp pilus assembly protein PilV